MNTEKQILEKTISDAQAVLDKATADLAALDKSELRHGDYGRHCDCWIYLGGTIHWLGVVGKPKTTTNNNIDVLVEGRLGNLKGIFDDLAAISEPLEKFTVESSEFSCTLSARLAHMHTDTSCSCKDSRNDMIWIDKGYGWFRKEELAEIILNLRRMEQTLKK